MVLADLTIMVAQLIERRRLRAIEGSCCFCFLNTWVRILALLLPALIMAAAILATINTYDKGFPLPRNARVIAKYGLNYSMSSTNWGTPADELVKPERPFDPWAIMSTIILGWVIKFGVSSIMFVWVQVRPGENKERLRGFGDVQNYFNNTEASITPCGPDGHKNQGQNPSDRRDCELASPWHGPSPSKPLPIPQHWNGQYNYPYPYPPQSQPHLAPYNH